MKSISHTLAKNQLLLQQKYHRTVYVYNILYISVGLSKIDHEFLNLNN